jgi:hypothetical protein
MTRQEKLDERRDALTKAHDVWEHEKYLYNQAIDYATDDPEPQADDVDTIRDLEEAKDILSKRTYIENDVFIMHALNAALTRLSAPVDVQARAEAVVRDFCFGTKRLYEDEIKELSRLIVEQFTRKG